MSYIFCKKSFFVVLMSIMIELLFAAAVGLLLLGLAMSRGLTKRGLGAGAID